MREFLYIHYPFHIIRQRCAYRQLFVRDRVDKSHLAAVQCLSAYQLTALAVHIVTHKG